jgi:hypothetical protein
METSNWLWIVGFSVNILITIGVWFFGIQRALATERNDHESRIAKLEADNDTFWRIMQPVLADALHHPNTPDRDRLLEKLRDGIRLDPGEIQELIAALNKVTACSDNNFDKLTAALLQVKLEQDKHRLERK